MCFLWIGHKPGSSVTEWTFFIIPYLNYVALVCTGMLVWVLDASRVSWQETERGRCAGFSVFSFLFFC